MMISSGLVAVVISIQSIVPHILLFYKFHKWVFFLSARFQRFCVLFDDGHKTFPCDSSSSPSRSDDQFCLVFSSSRRCRLFRRFFIFPTSACFCIAFIPPLDTIPSAAMAHGQRHRSVWPIQCSVCIFPASSSSSAALLYARALQFMCAKHAECINGE